MNFKVSVFSFIALIAMARAAYIGGPVPYGPGPVAYGHGSIAYGNAPVAYGHAPVAYGHAPVAYGTPTVTSQSDNILRSYGNLGQVATHTKTIDTPFSSVSKSDVRVSNPGYAVKATYPAYAAPAPAYSAYAAGPAYPGYARPVAAAHGGLLGVAYSAAPVVSHMTYSNAYGINYAY